MLVNFRVENFKSFKENTVFSMEAAKLKNLKKGNTFSVGKIQLLKSAVIYGANASGKSSIIDAIKKMKSIVNDSISIEKVKYYKAQPFLLNSETKNKGTIFEIKIIIEEVVYRYGFEIEIDSIILREWLYKKNNKARSKEVLVFNRNKLNIDLGASFKKEDILIEKTRGTALFLTVSANFNSDISEKITKWFDSLNILSNIKREDFKDDYLTKLEDDDFKSKIVNLVKNSDTGIYDISRKEVSYAEIKESSPEIEQLPSFFVNLLKKKGASTFETIHMQYGKDNVFQKMEKFPLGFESDGTKKLLSLTVPVIKALENGEILIVDELDNSLHTDLVEAIVKLFNSEKDNSNAAQLIFTTHDTNLLSQTLFRRDQIWFAQKNIFGSSEIYSLIEFGKGKIRDDLALEKNYLDGKFGAKPHIETLSYGDDYE